ncbi:DUF4197 domain-containing protein [Flavihumibacter sp. CACIAM 22H1]|uniref:DUF4197 domain-containing protein n=1 Tax=Flavihumibacter sp. CACIAM 22H1 TaxID=1812911 RepID=UPI0007A8651B|nr:DUF4197 domain-containing protein [Flavihumibacter sp. CACIAM 22H1]KYP13133.1 MAG: hypothetical protein A1D16_01390 [Flavihumibacter sp. CACIAM 22H1]
MRKLVLSLVAASLFATAYSQTNDNGGGILKKAGGLLNKNKSGAGLSSDDIVAGLKEALAIGTQNSASKLSAADGFFKDAAVKVLLPPEAQQVEQKLRALGMGKLVDDAILSINRAAEDASKSAAPIFVSAVKNMTVNDGLNILRGADTAATGYLRKSTSPELTAAFKPVIESSLEKTGATKYWTAVFDAYNKVSLKKVNPDLSSYVTGKAIDGIFYYVADEEKKIRTNPAARVNDLLKKVFGS